MQRTLLVYAAVVVFAVAPMAAAAAAVVATVRGAQAVNVRRGPDAQTAAFAMLPKGARVKVESIAGGWALVVLEHGERGYINAVYLALPPGTTLAAGPTVTTTINVASPATDTPAAAAAAPVTPPFEQKLAQVLERVAALESVIATPSVVPDRTHERGADTPLSRNVEPLVTPNGDTADLRDIGPSLALAGVGLVVGFFLGAAYGQRQERNRRQRVRF